MTVALGEVAAESAGAEGAGASEGATAGGRGASGRGGTSAAGRGSGGSHGPAVEDLFKGKSKSGGGGGKSRGPHRQLLVAEFVICMIVLALSPMTDNTVRPGQWMKRGSAMCALFIVLGMVSSVGKSSAKACAALGGLVTLVLLVDQRSIFTVLAKKLQITGDESTSQGGGGADADFGPPAAEDAAPGNPAGTRFDPGIVAKLPRDVAASILRPYFNPPAAPPSGGDLF